MPNKVQDILDAINNEDFVGAEASINAQLHSNAVDSVEAIRTEVSSSVTASEEGTDDE